MKFFDGPKRSQEKAFEAVRDIKDSTIQAGTLIEMNRDNNNFWLVVLLGVGVLVAACAGLEKLDRPDDYDGIEDLY